MQSYYLKLNHFNEIPVECVNTLFYICRRLKSIFIFKFKIKTQKHKSKRSPFKKQNFKSSVMSFNKVN